MRPTQSPPESSSDRPDGGWRLTGRHVLYAFLGFFGCILLVNGVFVYFALDTWTGLTNKQAYVDGLDYNSQLAAGAEQRALGWQVAVTAAPAEEGAWRINARFVDAGGQPIEGLSVSAALLRPTREGMDQDLVLQRVAAGDYAAAFVPAAPGNWDAVVVAERRGETVFRREQRLWLK